MERWDKMGTTLIKAECIDQVLRLTENPLIASGGVDEDVIEFSFGPLWDGFSKVAVMYRNERDVYHVQIADNRCTVPKEVLQSQGYFYVGVFGTKDGITRTSNVLSYRVEAGAITEGVKPPEPTPSIYESILASVNSAEELARSVRDDADAGRFDGAQGPKGEPGSDAEVTAENVEAALGYAPVSPDSLAAKQDALTDADRQSIARIGMTTGAAWTADERAAARERMGIAGFAEMKHITTLVTEEETNVLIVDLGKQCRICRFYYEFPETISTGYTYVEISNTNTLYYNMSGCAISNSRYLDYIRIASALKPISLFAAAAYIGNEATAKLEYSMPMNYSMDETTGFRYLKFTTYTMKFPKNTTIEVYAV